MARMDLNEDDEKVNIETIFWSAMDMLSDDDKKLPQARYPSLLLSFGFSFNTSIVSLSATIRFLNCNLEIMGSNYGNNISACWVWLRIPNHPQTPQCWEPNAIELHFSFLALAREYDAYYFFWLILSSYTCMLSCFCFQFLSC